MVWDVEWFFCVLDEWWDWVLVVLGWLFIVFVGWDVNVEWWFVDIILDLRLLVLVFVWIDILSWELIIK